MTFEVVCFTVTELQENSFLLHDPDGKTIIIDPGGDTHLMLDYLERNNLKLELILNTHGHADHVGGNVVLREATGAKIAVHSLDAPMLASSILSGAEFLGWRHREHQPDILLEDNQQIGCGSMQFEVRHTPGHSRGMCTFVCHGQRMVFPGDLIFHGSVGRWDLPGGDRMALLRSIRDRIVPLPGDYVLYPGHGPATTVGEEKVSNRYVVPIVEGEALDTLFA